MRAAASASPNAPRTSCAFGNWLSRLPRPGSASRRRKEPLMDREVLLEIGVEEMPASWLPAVTAQLAERLKGRLTEVGLVPQVAIEVHSTPRRLTACVPELVDRQEERDE